MLWDVSWFLIVGWIAVAAWLVFLVFHAARGYHRLVTIERVVLWGWAAVCVLVIASLIGKSYFFIAASSLPMIAIGLLIAFDFHGIADRLSARRIPAFPPRSRQEWRLQGAFCALVGAVFSLAFGRVF
jgi:hypothetical protein